MVGRALLIGLACPAVALAANVTVRLETDRIEVDQTIRAVVNVVDYEASAVPRMPVTPPGLSIEYLGQSSGISAAGRHVVRTASFTWAVTGLTEGQHDFGPVDIYVDGAAVSTDPVVLTVGPRTVTEDEPVISVFADFPVDEVWEGEIVIYRFGYRARIPVYADRWVLPPFDRLQLPRDGLEVVADYTIQDPTGPIQIKETYKPLLATAPGDLGLTAAAAILRIPDEQRGRRRPFGLTPSRDVNVVTEMAPLTVKALPPAPPGFAGLVGDFEVSGRLSANRVRVGESATLTVSIAGNGTLEGFALPEPPELDGARFYDTMVGADARVFQAGYRSEGRWQRVIVATETGELEVPPITVISFSPTTEDYVVHGIDVGSIRVGGTAEGDASVESYAPDVVLTDVAEPLEDDIRAIWTRGPLHPWFLGRWLPVLFGLAALPGVLVLAKDSAVALRRRWSPAPPPSDPLAPVRAAAVGSPERLHALDSALRESLGRRTGHHDRLAALDALPDELRVGVEQVLAELDRVRFADGGAPEDLDNRAIAAIVALLAKEAA